MSQIEKLLDRLYSRPKDFTYDEMKQVLNHFGFYEENKGKISCSRVVFVNDESIKMNLDKPHPTNVLKPYVIKQILAFLNERRNIL